MRRINPLLALLLLASAAVAQDKNKPRVYISESQSWEISGGFGGNRDGIGGGAGGGARPQTAEIIKTFNERCPGFIVTVKKERADYVMLLEHEGGKGGIRKDNKFVVFNMDGDALKSGSTRSLGNAVKDACEALTSDWQARGSRPDKPEPQPDRP